VDEAKKSNAQVAVAEEHIPPGANQALELEKVLNLVDDNDRIPDVPIGCSRNPAYTEFLVLIVFLLVRGCVEC
jgi:hypothetical protein